MIADIAALGLIEDDAIDLDTAALQLALLDRPTTDLAPYVELLNALTERLVLVGGAARTSQERARALVQVVAQDYRFSGDRLDYDNPDNADLLRVIDRRRGLPVSLAILYVSAARRLGWQAFALNTPGHVLVRIGPETEPVLIDPFSDGHIVDAEDLSVLLTRILGEEALPTVDHLQPMSNRSVLMRLIMNQAARAEAGGQVDRALILFERMTIVAPSDTHAWWARARLEQARGNIQGARACLSSILEITRDPAMHGHVHAALDALSG